MRVLRVRLSVITWLAFKIVLRNVDPCLINPLPVIGIIRGILKHKIQKRRGFIHHWGYICKSVQS